MSDLEQRVDALEKKVKLLEETLETLKNMNLSEQMEGYIQAKSRAVKMVDLLNQVSGESEIGFEAERNALERVRNEKTTVDKQIKNAMQNARTFSDDLLANPDLFDYEVETGTVIRFGKEKPCPELSSIVNKGLRITGYNGFDAERVVIPQEINGKPVVSIGKEAFINAPFSELILPKSLKAILENAFWGCKNLTRLVLPDQTTYLGDSCFSDCLSLSRVHLGRSIKWIGTQCFLRTAVTTIVFPEGLEKISNAAFNLPSMYDDGNIACVFLGIDTEVVIAWESNSSFGGVNLIYCHPGSKVQRYAREHNIPIKPLSEFKWEDYE